jgi:uncharacterized Zn-finger protein
MIKLHIKKPEILKCDKCSYKTIIKGFLHQHKKIHNKTFPCPKCDKKFPRPSILKEHLETHGTLKTYKCDQCKYAGKTKQNLRDHKYIHTRPFKCTKCKKGFASGKDLKIHVKNNH